MSTIPADRPPKGRAVPSVFQHLTGNGAVLLAALLCGLVVPLARVSGGLALLVLVTGAALVLFETWWVWALLIAGLAFSIELDQLPGAAAGVGLLERAYLNSVPTEPLILFLFAILVVSLFTSRRIALPRSKLHVAMVLYVGAMLFSLAFSAHFGISAKSVMRDLAYLFAGYFLCVFFVSSPVRLWGLLWTILAFNVMLAVYGLSTQLAGEVKIYGEVAEPFFKNHCIYAAFLALSMSVALSFLFEKRVRGRLVLTAVLALWSLAVVLTFVRGAWISLLAVLVYYLWVYRRQLSPRLVLLVAAAGCIVMFSVGALNVKYLFQERLVHALDTGYVTNHDRLDRWGAAASMFSSHPLSGVGWGAYADEYFSYIYYLDAYSTDIRMGAHNLYLEIAAESGLPGLAAFTLLVALFFYELGKLLRVLPRGALRCLAIGLGGALISYLVHAMVNNLGPSDKIGISFWLLFGLLVVAGRLAREEGATDAGARN